MQLFSIGIHKLNIDGTLDLDVNGEPQLTYVDNDIQNFARAWTAFERQGRRANYESEYFLVTLPVYNYFYDHNSNNDPMKHRRRKWCQ